MKDTLNKKLLIFGASFDPPHKLHLKILKRAIKEIKPNKIFIVPTYISPFKRQHMFDYKTRKKMIKILTRGLNNITIFDYEYKRKKKTYTWMVIKQIKKRYKNWKLYFLLGSDSFSKLHTWKNIDYLKKNLIFVVAIRKGYPKKNPYLTDIKKIELKERFENLSSTKIRNEIIKGELKNVVPKIRRIIKGKIIFLKFIPRLKKMLSPKRFNHTLKTAKLASILAEKHNADMIKALTAAFLHDSAKDMDIKKQIKIIKQARINIKKFEEVIETSPQIIHQWTSAIIAKKVFGIKDKEILSAISKHTTQDKKMSLLDKIIYVSDIASFERRFKEAKLIREIAFKDINKAYKMAKKVKLNYIKDKKGYVYLP